MERTDGINFLDDDVKRYFLNDETTTTLYRYTDPFKLKNKKLWISNPSIWHDPYERLFLRSRFLFKGGLEREHRFLNRVYCVCLTPESKNEAAWKVYEKAAKFTVNTLLLKQALTYLSTRYEIFVGFVNYIKQTDLKRKHIRELTNCTTEQFETDEPWARLLFLKRPDFSYEKEIRIILVEKNKRTVDGIDEDIPIESCKLYKHVELSPWLTEYESDAAYGHLMRKLHFKEEQITKSSLYQEVHPRRAKTY